MPIPNPYTGPTAYNPYADRENQTQAALQKNQAAAEAGGGFMGWLKNAGQALSAYNNKTLKNTPVGGAPSFYQVNKNDKSLAEVAASTGVPIDTLADLNKTKTLPPAGSYIALSPSQLISQGVPTAVANQIAKNGLASPSQSKTGGPMNLHGQSTDTVHVLTVQANQFATQIASGTMPNAIPASVVGFIRDADGTPFTLQDFYAEGYAMNAQGVLVKGSANGSKLPPPSAAYMATQAYKLNQNVEFLNQKRWDPTTKKYVSIGRLLKQGKLNIKTGRSQKPRNLHGKIKHGGGGNAAPVAVGEQSREGPQTALDIHLGSG